MTGRAGRSAAAPRCRITVKVSAGASRDRVIGWKGDALKLSVVAAPERGRANAAVTALLAAALGLPREAVAIVAGTTHPRKVVEIEGLDADEVALRLSPAGAE